MRRSERAGDSSDGWANAADGARVLVRRMGEQPAFRMEEAVTPRLLKRSHMQGGGRWAARGVLGYPF